MLPVLGTAAVMVIGIMVIAGPSQVWSSAAPAAASALLAIAVLSPVALLAARGRIGAARPLMLVMGFLVLSYVIHALPAVGPFVGLGWNWQGKTLELIWLAVLLCALPLWARDEVGVRGPQPGSGRPAWLLIGALFVIFGALSLVAYLTGELPTDNALNAERVLFDALHPNLVEELLWRGVLLALLDRALGTPWRVFGAQVGWGLVLVTVGFGLCHGLLITDEGLYFSPGEILLTGFLGLLIGWVRARTGSVWMAYVAHCVPELAIHAGAVVGKALS
ncbi:MAG: CPBP family intramembrane glutamic endopeptidase [Tessaracoccus sp.]